MKGRILLIAPLPPPIGGDTMTSKRLLESRYWDEAGYGISIIDTSPGEGVRTTRVRRTWKDPGRAAKIIWKLVPALRQADLVLLWSNSSFIVSLGIPVMRLIRASGTPYIVKPFGSLLAERIGGVDALRRKAVVQLLNGAEYVLPETGELSGELERAGIDAGRLVTFPNVIPDGLIPDVMPEGSFSGRCVFVGQIKEEKGVFDILEALRGREGISCDFYGQIIRRDEDRFFKAVDSCPGCRYRGTVASGDVVDTIAGYDVLLLPTLHPSEGYPAVVLEAFAAGVPVVATRWKAIPELIADGERGILTEPSSPAGIADAIGRLASDEALYGSIARNAYDFVKGFSEEKMIGDRLLGIVSGILGAR